MNALLPQTLHLSSSRLNACSSRRFPDPGAPGPLPNRSMLASPSMTRYHYEALTHETFQKLAQALITHLHPDAQCLPIGQPDGGRDALVRAESDAASVVFQVKYSRAPQLKDERRVIQDLGLRASWLLLAGRLADIGGDRALYSAACSEFFAEQAGFSERDVGVVDALVPLHVLTDLLDAGRLALVLDDGDDGDGDCGKEDVVDVVDVVSMGNWTEYEEGLARCRQAAQTDDERALAEFASFVCDHLQTDVSQWRAELAPWTAIVDRGLELVPDGALFESIAAIAAGVRAGEDGGEWGEDGFDRRRGLVAPRLLGGATGGRSGVVEGSFRGENAALCCGVFLASAEAGVVQALSPEVVARVEGLDGRQWARLGTIYRRVGRVLEERRERVGEKWFDGCAGIGPRTALAMIGRVGDPEAQRRLARRLFADYEGGDWTVLRGVANWENVDGNWGDADWELLSELSRRARKRRCGRDNVGAVAGRERVAGGRGCG